MELIFRVHPSDTVAVALTDLAAGETVHGITLREPVKAGHKLALVDIEEGQPVIKYGQPIGIAGQSIEPGQWVHTHNLRTALSGTLEYIYHPAPAPARESVVPGSFMGFCRENGSVGIRNEVWIIPTVGCVNAIGKAIARAAEKSVPAGVDGITAYAHPYGCSQLGDDHLMTQRALCGLIRHPNAGGVLVLGLGCENNGIESLKAQLGAYNPDRVKFLNCQDCSDEVAAALPLITELLTYAAGFRRQPCGAEALVIGLKCGGSDGFSGITANPLLGRYTDRLTAAGGTVILTEVPEMFGAEHLLMNRCVSRDVFDKTVRLVNEFKGYFLSHDQPVGENPSPGNREGGITTLEEKSLGCTQKGGSAPVTGVLEYGESVADTGLHLLQAPGNDLVASAALAVSGAQLVLFTTGRGTPFGCPVPTVKVASNSALSGFKPAWIDFDAGCSLEQPMETVAEQLYAYVLEVASGLKAAKSEQLDKSDLAIWKNGVTL